MIHSSMSFDEMGRIEFFSLTPVEERKEGEREGKKREVGEGYREREGGEGKKRREGKEKRNELRHTINQS